MVTKDLDLIRTVVREEVEILRQETNGGFVAMDRRLAALEEGFGEFREEFKQILEDVQESQGDMLRVQELTQRAVKSLVDRVDREPWKE